MFQILLAQLITHIIQINQLLPIRLQLLYDLLHRLHPRLMLVVITQHLEYNLHQRKEVFIALPMLDPVTVPYRYDLRIDTPNHVVKNIRKKCHHVLEYRHHLEVQWFPRLYVFEDR